MSIIRVATIEPEGATTTLTLGLSGDTVTSSADSIKTNTFKDAGGNTLWTSDGSGTLSSINAGFAVAGPILILSQTVTDGASISFTSGIDSTYNTYMFVCTDINPATDNGSLLFQVNASGQSGFNESITSTTFVARHNEADTVADLYYDTGPDQASGTGYQLFMTSMANDADASGAGILYLFSPASTTYVKNFYSTTSSYQHSSAEYNLQTEGFFNVTAAITEIDFKIQSGNFDGKITMYGIK